VRRARKPGALVALKLALTLALPLALAGCGHQSTQRQQVAAYVRHVGTIEGKLAKPVLAVTRAGGQFAAAGRKSAPLTEAQARALEQTLVQSQAQIEAQGRKLRMLHEPPAAGNLHSLVLRFTDGEVALTHQLAQMVAFLPRFNAELTPLGPAATRLAAVLSKRQAFGAAAVAALFAAKAKALRTFAATTTQTVTRLRLLSPPPVLKPQFEAQLGSLRGMGASAGRLADALASGVSTNVAPLLTAFDRAAAATHTPAARRAQTVAVRAYNARITRLAALAQAIARERLRLSNSLT
jgi:hypothetical protein